MSQHSDEEYKLGFEDCACDGLAVDANDSPCVSCGKRVKYGDHVHFKGELFHSWCLTVAALKQSGVERKGAIRLLREICEAHGDNDWPDDLQLEDILEKHLLRHLER
jgi:hypothetical protein